MNARPALLADLEGKLAVELDWFDGRIGDRCHLVGDRLGRADVTAASLLAPLARPAARPAYRQVRLPPRVEQTLNAWRSRPGLRWVDRLYAEHRG